jgi:hypothetical protein
VTHRCFPSGDQRLWSVVMWRLGGGGLHLRPALNYPPYS